jgi:hypothetical protein
LTWTGDEYALRYEIVVERESDGRYTELHTEFTEASFLELSLIPGIYRYRVRPYDLLNHPSEWIEWKIFEVPVAASKPVLVSSNDKEPTPLSFFFRPSWVIFIPLYGELIPYFGFKIFPPGPRLGIDMTSSIRGSFNAGVELAAICFFLSNFFDEQNIKVNMIMLDLNFLVQKQFSNQKAALSFRFGMGLTILADKETRGEGVYLDPVTGQINLGISCLLPFKENGYLETGIDFSHLIGWNAGSLRPWIGFGIRF